MSEEKSILLEAQEITHGARRHAYGHPADDYQRTAGMVSAMLAHKLKEPLTPAEMTMVMCCVKLSRQINRAGRDNMLDLAGYAWCTQEIIEEMVRRESRIPQKEIVRDTAADTE